MEQSSSRYYFRKRDYLKIRNWYEMAKYNYIPEDSLQLKKSEKSKEWHFRFQFQVIELNEEYVNSILKNIANVKQVIMLSSIFQKSGGYVVSHGKQLVRQCSFDLKTYLVTFKEEVALYFYIDDVTPRDYEFCLEVQIVTNQGIFFKLGSIRYSLNQIKETTKSKFLLYTHGYHQFQLQEAPQKGKNAKKQLQNQIFPVGTIQIEQDLDQIKDINKYLPHLKILDQHSKLPPSTNFNIKKKKQQLVIDPPFKISLESLLIKINNPAEMKKQILSNNPFTMSHKELVQFQIKQYSITLDLHNGWKFLNQNKNRLIMELIIQNEQEIYVSSKQTEKLNLGYYDNEYTLFIIILACKVEFKIKESFHQRRTNEFIIGWLPLPLDLSLKQNKIDMYFVNDHPFPASQLFHLGVQSNFTANFIHPLYQKYKIKQDDRKVMMNDLPILQTNSIEPNKYLKINTKKTQMLSSGELVERQAHLQAEIENMRTFIEQTQNERQKNRLALVLGRAQTGQLKENQQCKLNMEDCVGKILRIKIEIKSLIPQTESPSLYYLPRKLKATLYCLRQKFNFDCHINQTQVKYHIPISLNCNKSSFTLKIYIESVQEFESILNSRLIITLYEQDTFIMYSKGIVALSEVLGEQKVENVTYLPLRVWNQQNEISFGTILLNSFYQLEKIRANYTKVQEFQVSKEMQKLSMEERLKMRIGNFKGDNETKSKAVTILKQRKHLEFVSNVVDSEYMSDGELVYQLGFSSYYLLSFTNEDKSENNIFTFHLNCPYAQLINNEQDFRNIVSSLNVETQNYKLLQYIMKDRQELSYYQTTLNFNQSIGLLICLNVNEYKQVFSLKKIELIVKRNTLESKRLVLKCTYKQPLIWDVVQSHEVIQSQDNELRIPLVQQMSTKYKQISILNENIKYDYRTKEIVFQRHGLTTYELYCIVTPNYSKIKKLIIFKVMLFPGKKVELEAGQKIYPSIEYQNKFSIQIIRSQSRQVHISSHVRFSIPLKSNVEELYIQFLRPVSKYPIIISTYDLSGQRLWSYLLKVTATLSTNYRKIEVFQRQNISFTLYCQNPYACRCKFNLFCFSKMIKLSEDTFEIPSYESKPIIARIPSWNSLQSSIFIFINDKRGNIIQTFEVAFNSKESIIYQNQ